VNEKIGAIPPRWAYATSLGDLWPDGVASDGGLVDTKLGYQCLPGHNELQIAKYSELLKNHQVPSVTYYLGTNEPNATLGVTRDLLFQLAMHGIDVEWLDERQMELFLAEHNPREDSVASASRQTLTRDPPRLLEDGRVPSPSPTVPVIFRVKLGKTGKSLRVTVPKPITDSFDWKEGDEIELAVTEQEITLRRVVKQPQPTG
jgi:AbrB family looped-hinge helix DNA binding protein